MGIRSLKIIKMMCPNSLGYKVVGQEFTWVYITTLLLNIQTNIFSFEYLVEFSHEAIWFCTLLEGFWLLFQLS